MANPPPYPDSGPDSGGDAGDGGGDALVGPERAPDTGTPRWVKVFGIVALVVVLLFVVLQLVGGGGHGSGRHTGAGEDRSPLAQRW